MRSTFVNKSQCCGCSACYSICPKKSITLEEDGEGFLYPSVDKNLCSDCGLCKKVCPVVNVVSPTAREQKGYLVQIRDEEIRRESTSGGAFTGIAQYVIAQGGVVFGAAYDTDFQVVHTFVEQVSELRLFRNSKYVQSKMGDSFWQVKKFLSEGRLVCFSGTPCQVEGLFHYLGGEHENLILVDIVCHAVPSPKVWNKYLEVQKNKFGSISNIRFRDKYWGYKYSNLAILNMGGGKICYHAGLDSDIMLRAFFSDICDRPSCYQCCFKKRYRVSDFTLWDCFEPEELSPSLIDSNGTTCVLIHSDKGALVFEKIKTAFRHVDVDPDRLTQKAREMFFSVSVNPRREMFFSDLNSLSSEALFKKYFPVSWRHTLEKYIRIISFKIGIYSRVKKLSKRVLGVKEGVIRRSAYRRGSN